MKLKQLIIILLVLITLNSVSALSTISGTIYDISLNKVNNVNVEIDSIPLQRDITENGLYSFNIQNGTYTIDAKQYKNGVITATAKENITIETDGEFVIDLVLFPDFTEEEELASIELNLNDELLEDLAEETSDFQLIIGIAFVLFIAFFIILLLKGKAIEEKKIKETIEKKEETATSESKHKNLPKELQELIEFIKSKDNRITQLDIRKEFPSSEAKVSLMITDLEQRGILKKIKKGRGNIIILND